MALATNLVSYWKMEGNSTDSVGSNTGTDTAISYGTSYGKLGNGALFASASNSVITKTSPVGLPVSGSARTISAWIKTSTTGVSQGIVSWGTASSSQACTLYITSSNIINFSPWGGQITANRNVCDGNWHHIVLVLNSSTSGIIYIDGVNDTNAVSFICSDNAGTLRIGRNVDNTGSFNGSLDEVGIWSRALSADEVSQLFNSGRGNAYPLTDTPNLYGGIEHFSLESNSNGSISSTICTDTSITYSSGNGKVSNGAGLNGTSSRISIPDSTRFNPTSQISVSCWIKPTTIGSRYVAKWDGINTWLLESSATNFNFYVKTGSLVNATTTTGVGTGSWVFLTGTYDGANVKIYVNGTLENTAALTGAITTNTHVVYIGTNENATSFYNGAIDEVTIFNRALSSTEVTTLYNGGAGLAYPWSTTSTPVNRNFFML